MHDGQQIVATYRRAADGSWKLFRRSLWGAGVDELAVLQVDGDGDGVLDGTLYAVSDPWGSVEVLLDEAGRLVERVETLPEGKPRIFGEDRKRPEVLRVVWTGNGQTAAGQVPAGVLELSFSEPMRAGSVAKARITLAGQDLSGELSQDGRRLVVAASPVAGQQVTLRVEGLEDRSGNLMQPLEVSFTVADSGQYQVLYDSAAPQVLAILDEGEGVSVLFDDPVVPGPGMELASAITVTRAGAPVEGSVTRISPWQLTWKASDPSAWLLGGEYRVSVAGLVELAPEAKPVSSSLLPASFTHLASGSEKHIVASVPPETPPRAASAFGNTTLFQGLLWVPELGLYYYRARWYDPQLGDFLERDPLGPVDSPNLYQALGRNPVNITDPQGLYEKDFHFYAVYYLARAAGFAPADARLLAWSSQYVDDYEHTNPAPMTLRGLRELFSGHLGEILGSFHFLSPEEPAAGYPGARPQYAVQRANSIALLVLQRAAETRDLVSLGIALHSFADTFAHEGRTALALDLRNAARPQFVGSDWGERAGQAIKQVAGALLLLGHSAAGNAPDWPWLNPEKAVAAAKAIYSFLRSWPKSASAQGHQRTSDWGEIESRVRSMFWVRGHLEDRIEAWKFLIAFDFGDDVNYDLLLAPPSLFLRFQWRVEEQRNFVICILRRE